MGRRNTVRPGLRSIRLFDFEAFGGFGKEVRSTLREAANQLSNKLSHAQHLDEVTWTTKNWHGLQMQRLSVVLHTAVAWQTVNELACGESGIVHVRALVVPVCCERGLCPKNSFRFVAAANIGRGHRRLVADLKLTSSLASTGKDTAGDGELGWKGAYVRFGNTETGLLKLVKGRGKWSPSEATAAADCDLRLFDFEAFGGFGKEVRSTLREAANQLSNKLSHAQHLDEVTWTTKNWHGLQMQRLSVVLHTAVAWQTVNELACGESGIVHGVLQSVRGHTPDRHKHEGRHAALFRQPKALRLAGLDPATGTLHERKLARTSAFLSLPQELLDAVVVHACASGELRAVPTSVHEDEWRVTADRVVQPMVMLARLCATCVALRKAARSEIERRAKRVADARGGTPTEEPHSLIALYVRALSVAYPPRMKPWSSLCRMVERSGRGRRLARHSCCTAMEGTEVLLKCDSWLQSPANYMQSQPHINERMREILVDWLTELGEGLAEVATSRGVLSQSFHLAVALLDHHLASADGRGTSRHRLQLVGCACFGVALRYEDIVPSPDRRGCAVNDEEMARAMAYFADADADATFQAEYVATCRKVRRMELAGLAASTTLVLVERLLRELVRGVSGEFQPNGGGRYIARHGSDDPERTLKYACLYLAELSLTRYSLLRWRRSVVAAASVRAACVLVDPLDRAIISIGALDDGLLVNAASGRPGLRSLFPRRLLGHSDDETDAASSELLRVVKLAPIQTISGTSRPSAIFQKYQRQQFDAVADLHVLVLLLADNEPALGGSAVF
ncbi:Hypothetical protein EMIHUDRAFT_236560 [Emiliania huxleyi CCMP1516]|uniref:Cyclin C-terminal domain-containing protein n=2 Tax=Emiliania huxleyi TaxID=2903 RepID=A0A0D3JTB7_EMIH1|nr:Hypothetical protein EMIHUDRAFT_236560 [Emiliania huxleyi CCMP1516]EOD26752.1 Hypothetical protein EMIHUDRAFT_236560 [Emiliania huxleyi CCMP1516]|eukprot:XP_005779181.1 Hypothetical protein EMIHUDRAFT_236560 [Emiliania huxleyi CCMP1516]